MSKLKVIDLCLCVLIISTMGNTCTTCATAVTTIEKKTLDLTINDVPFHVECLVNRTLIWEGEWFASITVEGMVASDCGYSKFSVTVGKHPITKLQQSRPTPRPAGVPGPMPKVWFFGTLYALYDGNETFYVKYDHPYNIDGCGDPSLLDGGYYPKKINKYYWLPDENYPNPGNRYWSEHVTPADIAEIRAKASEIEWIKIVMAFLGGITSLIVGLFSRALGLVLGTLTLGLIFALEEAKLNLYQLCDAMETEPAMGDGWHFIWDYLYEIFQLGTSLVAHLHYSETYGKWLRHGGPVFHYDYWFWLYHGKCGGLRRNVMM